MEVFEKHSHSPTTRFLREAEGLNALRYHSKFRIPEVLSVDENHIKLEKIRTRAPKPGFWHTFAEKLRDLHSRPQEAFGFSNDNHIGYTPQRNTISHGSWADYFCLHRLQYMVNLLGHSHPQVKPAYAQAEDLIFHRLNQAEVKPALVHGDLWSGNFLCDEDNEPVLIDPACYWGHSEVDLAMSELFGGFDREFYEAYCLPAGYKERRDIYNLYHLMNHWLLFGGGYASQVMSRLEQLKSVAKHEHL